MHLFETMKLDKGFIPRLDYHYQRISTSSEHLGFQFDHLFWKQFIHNIKTCLLYTSPSPRDGLLSRMPSSA